MICCNTRDDTAISISEDGKKFKKLHETYKFNMFFLAFAMMYPNPQYDRVRLKLVVCIVLSTIPSFVLIGNDIRIRIRGNDFENMIRQSIIFVSMLFIDIKLIFSVIRKKELREIIDDMNKDYDEFNELPEDYQEIVMDTVKTSQMLEKMWISILVITGSTYPLQALIMTIHSQFFDEVPKRFMIHEMHVILFSDVQYKSPYFEIVYAFSLYIVCAIVIGFIGYDGLFSMSILHVSLKFKLIAQDLTHLMDDPEDLLGIRRKMAKFVRDHNEIQRLIDKIQTCFEVYLVSIFCNAIVQIGMALSQTTSIGESGFNTMFYLFLLATIFHVYLPCHLASGLTHNAAEIANFAYSCNWEDVRDASIRKSLIMIIAKAQVPNNFRALGMLTFNMEMFVSIMQTSYSMYTLLRE